MFSTFQFDNRPTLLCCHVADSYAAISYRLRYYCNGHALSIDITDTGIKSQPAIMPLSFRIRATILNASPAFIWAYKPPAPRITYTTALPPGGCR